MESAHTEDNRMVGNSLGAMAGVKHLCLILLVSLGGSAYV
jgi:hypothetical protein